MFTIGENHNINTDEAIKDSTKYIFEFITDLGGLPDTLYSINDVNSFITNANIWLDQQNYQFKIISVNTLNGLGGIPEVKCKTTNYITFKDYYNLLLSIYGDNNGYPGYDIYDIDTVNIIDIERL